VTLGAWPDDCRCGLGDVTVVPSHVGDGGTASRHAGTTSDPHVFLGLVRDHRGLRPGTSEYEAFWALHDKLRAGMGAPVGMGPILVRRLETGSLPFQVFVNTVDGARWGKYYNATTATLIIKPVPPADWLGGAVNDVGHAIVVTIDWVKDAVVWLCGKLRTESGNPKWAAAKGVLLYAGVPGVTEVTAGVAIAQEVCIWIDRARTAVAAASGPPDIDTGGDGVVVSKVGSQVAPTPRYPAAAFAVYDAGVGSYRILVPAEGSP
jgi:hypothetical protein